jgi:YHS domain-containing protein
MSNESVKDNPVEEPTRQIVHDPVCHMDINASDAAGSAEYEDRTFYFCSTRCHQAFNADPVAVLHGESIYNHEETEKKPAGVYEEEALPVPDVPPVSPGTAPKSGVVPANLSTQTAEVLQKARAAATSLIQQAADTAQPKGRAVERTAQEQIRRKPVLATLLAFASGCMATLLLRTRLRRTQMRKSKQSSRRAR